ncbi:hypothetical protein ACU4GD_42975 [Cupriavidus basilensis]
MTDMVHQGGQDRLRLPGGSCWNVARVGRAAGHSHRVRRRDQLRHAGRPARPGQRGRRP